jgi:ParB family chromosome partitioning protein
VFDDRPIESETSKIVENSYRATTLAFLNEWSLFAERNGVDLINRFGDRFHSALGFTQSSALSTQNLLLIVAGERRFKAAQLAGLTTVPGICVEGNPSEIALVENLLRQDLTSVEEAEALQRLMEEQKYSQEQLAGIIGKARQTINEILLVNRLPQEIRDECRGDRKISRTSLIEIARKKQVRGMQTAYEKYKDKVKKAAEGRTKQVKEPETAADVMTWLSKAVNKLNGLDASAWTEDEKNTFNQTLLNLQETIQALLNPSAPSNLA